MNKLTHLEAFLTLREKTAPESIESIESIASKFVSTPGQFIKAHNFLTSTTSLLVGHVQSGKTGHYLGIVAAVADNEPRFPIFVLLTQNSVPLHTQTLNEAKKVLPRFDVFGELDQLDFKNSLTTKLPKLIVLKKEIRTLKKWKSELPKELLAGRSLFIVDDEADAGGLNNAVRRGDQTPINREIENLVQGHRSFFLQVTATPQAIFKMDPSAGAFKPASHLYFPPGKNYLGGDFFFPSDFDPQKPPYIFEPTPNNELAELQDPSLTTLPLGLRMALFTYLITVAFRIGIKNDKSCNFLIHPSITKIDHALVQRKLQDFLRTIRSGQLKISKNSEFKKCYENLKSTKPNLSPIDEILAQLALLSPNVLVLNSSEGNLTREIPKDGANIFIGGNVLSRGIVLPSLQTTYYCRTATRPNIDTYWQHSRCFGYDRDETLIRMFMPPLVYSAFCQMNDSTERLFESLAQDKTSDIKVVTPRGIGATRRTVYLDDRAIIGGVNYFPLDGKSPNNKLDVDTLASAFSDSKKHYEVSDETIKQLISLTHFENIGAQFKKSDFLHAISAVQKPSPNSKNSILIVRRNRRISANTGSLLSPDDYRLSKSFTDKTVLVIYELTGEKSLGWGGKPFWVPNIKLPAGISVHL